MLAITYAMTERASFPVHYTPGLNEQLQSDNLSSDTLERQYFQKIIPANGSSSLCFPISRAFIPVSKLIVIFTAQFWAMPHECVVVSYENAMETVLETLHFPYPFSSRYFSHFFSRIDA